MELQNATVEFGRTVKPADFESKPVKVILTGIVRSADELKALGDMAHAEVHRLLGLVDAIPAATRPATIPPTPAADPLGGAGAAQAPSAAPASPPAPVSPPPSDPLAPAVPAAEISNEQMQAAAVAKSQEMQAAGRPVVQIRNLVASYVEAPKNAYDIPQSQRAEFLAKLAAL